MKVPARAIRAVETNLWAVQRDFARIPGAEVHDDAGLLWFTAPSKNAWLNGASRARLDDATVDAAIETVVGQIGGLGRSLMWHVGPSSTPGDLGSRLEARGFEGDVDRSMVLSIDDLHRTEVDPRFVISAVRTRESLLDWLRAWDLAIGVEPRGEQHPWLNAFGHLALEPETPAELFVGRLGDEAVSSSLAFVGGGAVGLYGVGTAPDHRGHGFGGAVTTAGIEWGRSRGEQFAILHSSQMGEPVYRRLGFEAVGELTQLVLRAPPPEPEAAPADTR